MAKTAVEKHFDKVASSYDSGKNKYSFYYSNLKKLLASLIEKNKCVFEFGCGTGDLLTSLNPKRGYGMDISPQMIAIAKVRHKDNKNLVFSTQLPKVKFDYIFLSDVIEHLEKPENNFDEMANLMKPKAKLILTMANPTWEPLLMIWEKLGLKMKEGEHNRIKNHELRIMLEKSGMKVIKHDYKLLIPIKIPLVTDFANRYLERYLKGLAFIEYFVIVKS